jgi:hypothetical protein
MKSTVSNFCLFVLIYNAFVFVDSNSCISVTIQVFLAMIDSITFQNTDLFS